MPRDSEILADIRALLAHEDALKGSSAESGESSEWMRLSVDLPLANVPLPLIIPAGYARGVALDTAGNVVGVKLAQLRDAAPDVISTLCRLKYLERLVFYSENPSLDIPPAIKDLTRLRFLWFGGRIKSLPEELLTLRLPFKHDSFLENLSEQTREVVAQLHVRLKEKNPKEPVMYSEGHVTPSIEEDLLAQTGIFLALDELEDPPLEIANKGRDAIERYFLERRRGYLPLQEVKVILVGNGGAGETSLVRRLMNEDFDPEEPQTHGINIRKWEIHTAQGKVTLHFWDFGGQEIMHATHQFFLSKPSVYILVLDGRKDEDPEYRLQHIESFGGDSPVFLILNRIDEHPAFDVNRRFLKNKYRTIIDFFRTSCADDIGVDILATRIGQELANVPMLQTRWPASWFRVKQHLNSPNTPFLSLSQYRLLCAQEQIVDVANQELLVDVLHDLGVILHFTASSISCDSQ